MASASSRTHLAREHARLLYESAQAQPMHGFLQGEAARLARAEILRHLVA